MEDLNDRLNTLHAEYRRIFTEYALSFEGKVQAMKPADFNGDIFAHYERNSKGFLWQKNVLCLIEELTNSEIKKIKDEIQNMRMSYECRCCGSCCKMACSEFSPAELKQKANDGDKFAGEFTNIFIPCEDSDVLKDIFPQYIELLKNNTKGRYYFYRCPKVTQDNRCPDYENRPQICRDFPDNPIAFLHPLCAYNDWKKQSEPAALRLRAMSEISHFYKTKLQYAIRGTNAKL